MAKTHDYSAEAHLRERKIQRVFTLITHHARSGMSRNVRVFYVEDGEIVEISSVVGRAIGYTVTRDMAIRVKGCGFDAEHDVVYALSLTLYGKGDGISHGRL